MRCSSCEPLLDQFVEGTLPAAQMQTVAKHVHECAQCARLLEELKVLDALLLTHSEPELPRNFTFRVMAEVNSMPVPALRRMPVWSFVALYVAAAWAAAIAGLLLAGIPFNVIAARILSGFNSLAAEMGAIANAFAQGFGTQTPFLAAFGFGLLLLDIAVTAGAIFFYYVIRPRLAAHLALSKESA